MQFQNPSVVHGPEKAPAEGVLLEAGIEGFADATGLDAAALGRAAVALVDGETAVVMIVGAEMSDVMVLLAYGPDVADAATVVMKTPPAPPPEMRLAPTEFGVVDAEGRDGDVTVTMVDGTTTPGLVVGMVTEVANVEAGRLEVEIMAG
jgi:hypothetical protein